jgi:hypothetical protein
MIPELFILTKGARYYVFPDRESWVCALNLM